MAQAFAMNSYLGKQILALVRDGDYAHAGEEEAIELALAGLAKDASRRLLDAGCGRGGTASYMQRHGWGRVTGVDLEPKSIDYARDAFPDGAFMCCDIHDVGAHVGDGFDAVVMFNVLYAIADQAGALRALAGRAKSGADLMVFDYVDLGGYAQAPVLDAGRPFLPHPLKIDRVEGLLRDGGWRLQSVADISAEYRRWYAALVERVAEKRAAIEALAGADAYEHVHGRYAGLLAAIESGHLGGAVVRATKARA
ncbi:Methyltransferase domain-containing protein [Hyphomicrobium sp. 1Nfss2.1]|uniref:class I SAM-dependent methyltransferase n=1 Tax=Hyphomicrobium sp. 1Nfss2.1 TaxID=3413936 RepID=UPI003C799E25